MMTKSFAVQHVKDKISARAHPGTMPPMHTGRTADPTVGTERMRTIPMRRPGGSDIHEDGGHLHIGLRRDTVDCLTEVL